MSNVGVWYERYKLSTNWFPVSWRSTAAGADWYGPALQPGNPQQTRRYQTIRRTALLASLGAEPDPACRDTTPQRDWSNTNIQQPLQMMWINNPRDQNKQRKAWGDRKHHKSVYCHVKSRPQATRCSWPHYMAPTGLLQVSPTEHFSSSPQPAPSFFFNPGINYVWTGTF